MAHPKGELTHAQFELMEVLWAAAWPLTATEVQRRLASRRALARNTVLTQLDRLAERRWVDRKELDGRVHYAPTMGRETAVHDLAQSFIRQFFGGSPVAVLQSLLGGAHEGEVDFDRLRDLIDRAEAGSGRGGKPGGHS